MTQQQATERCAYELWMANGRQPGYAEDDWRHAERLVEATWGSGQRCVPTTARDGRMVVVTVSVGHSSY